jgi:hypothetical protein
MSTILDALSISSNLRAIKRSALFNRAWTICHSMRLFSFMKIAFGKRDQGCEEMAVGHSNSTLSLSEL